MNATADQIDLSPPGDTRWSGPLTLALIAHGLLVAALTWGVSWTPDATEVAVEAELWSRLPQEAAPRLVEPTPAPPPPPAPEPKPVKPAPEPPRPAPPPPAPAPDRAEIALEAKKKAEEKRKAEALKQAEDKKKADALKREETKKLEEKKKAEQKKADQKKQELAEQKKREQAKLDAERKKREDAAKAAEEKRRDAQLAADRQKNLERMMGQAGATGNANAKGTAQQSSGPSASYGGRVVARIKPNIVFTDVVNGNPHAVVEIRVLPDGTIVNSKLTQSSGNKAWDDAVLRAVERTATLPRDENGKVPSPIVLDFRPRD